MQGLHASLAFIDWSGKHHVAKNGEFMGISGLTILCSYEYHPSDLTI
jgi:hypothetical protein